MKLIWLRIYIQRKLYKKKIPSVRMNFQFSPI